MLIETGGEDHRWIKESMDQMGALADAAPPAPAAAEGDPIDPFVRQHLGASCGHLYSGVAQRLTRYPIPNFPMPPGHGRLLLDLGCMWGRWTVAAARRGYHVVGIDPGLNAILAAKRVARQLGVEATFVVGDARYMPFRDRSFDAVFSYSVLQHFSMDSSRRTLAQVARCLKPGGTCLIQLAQVFGLRSLMVQAQRGFKKPSGFDVRHWSVPRMRRTFREIIGPTRLRVDGFFNLNPQPTDLLLLPLKSRMVVRISEALRKLSRLLPFLIYVADSIYVEATTSCLETETASTTRLSSSRSAGSTS
ncbi:MAG: class I SAM-dependent methyltransferase [Gammaproteobacteria bacterium]